MTFLALTGAQEMLIFVCMYVCLFQVCQGQSIFIFLGYSKGPLLGVYVEGWDDPGRSCFCIFWGRLTYIYPKELKNPLWSTWRGHIHMLFI